MGGPKQETNQEPMSEINQCTQSCENTFYRNCMDSSQILINLNSAGNGFQILGPMCVTDLDP